MNTIITNIYKAIFAVNSLKLEDSFALVHKISAIGVHFHGATLTTVEYLFAMSPLQKSPRVNGIKNKSAYSTKKGDRFQR